MTPLKDCRTAMDIRNIFNEGGGGHGVELWKFPELTFKRNPQIPWQLLTCVALESYIILIFFLQSYETWPPKPTQAFVAKVKSAFEAIRDALHL